MVQLESVKAPIQPYEKRLSKEGLVELGVGKERAPALKPNNRRLLRCMTSIIELEVEKCDLTHESCIFSFHLKTFHIGIQQPSGRQRYFVQRLGDGSAFVPGLLIAAKDLVSTTATVVIHLYYTTSTVLSLYTTNAILTAVKKSLHLRVRICMEVCS